MANLLPPILQSHKELGDSNETSRKEDPAQFELCLSGSSYQQHFHAIQFPFQSNPSKESISNLHKREDK